METKKKKNRTSDLKFCLEDEKRQGGKWKGGVRFQTMKSPLCTWLRKQSTFPITNNNNKKKTKKKSNFFEILAWSTVNRYPLSTSQHRQRPCNKTSYAHKTHLKKPNFSTSFLWKQTDQRESENPRWIFTPSSQIKQKSTNFQTPKWQNQTPHFTEMINK